MGNKVHSEEGSRRTFTLPTQVPLLVWTISRISTDNVNIVHVLYGINIFTLRASFSSHMGLVCMKFLYSVTLIMKIIIVRIY